MHSQPRYFVISAPTFDGTTPLDPTSLAPKSTNPGGGLNPVPTQNEPRTAATLTVPVGRFSIRSLLRDGRLAALVRVRSITPPDPGDFWQLRSAAVGEQVDPPPINQPLLPAKALTQEWSEVFLAGPTDAISVVHNTEVQVNPQIEIEVSEYAGALATGYMAALAKCSLLAAQIAGLRSTITWSPGGYGQARTWDEVYAAILAALSAGSLLTVIGDRRDNSEPQLRIPPGQWLLGSTSITSKRFGNPAINTLYISDGAVLVDPGGVFKSVEIVAEGTAPVFAFTNVTNNNPPVFVLDTGGVGRNDGTAPCYVVPPGQTGVLALLAAGIEPGLNGAPVMSMGVGSTIILRLTNGVQVLDPNVISGPPGSTMIVSHDGTVRFPLTFPSMFGTVINEPLGIVGGAGPTSFRPANPCTGCQYFNTNLGFYEAWNGAWMPV